jgi:hypothetical protein
MRPVRTKWPTSRAGRTNATYLDYGSAGFNIRNNGAGLTTMHMTNAGNVGIGTSTPTYRLTLAGGVNAF